MKHLIFALLLLSSSAFADPWSSSDTYRETTFQVLNVIDWGQTRYIAQNPNKYYEHDYSGLIGSNPTTGRIDAFMVESAAIHLAVSYLLPNDWRIAFQYITIVEKLNTTDNNAKLGIKISF